MNNFLSFQAAQQFDLLFPSDHRLHGGCPCDQIFTELFQKSRCDRLLFSFSIHTGLPGQIFHRPVEQVSWNDAMAFCEKLNDLGLAPAGYKFSLPTEAQWEFAARGGNMSKGYKYYSGSNAYKDVAAI